MGNIHTKYPYVDDNYPVRLEDDLVSEVEARVTLDGKKDEFYNDLLDSKESLLFVIKQMAQGAVPKDNFKPPGQFGSKDDFLIFQDLKSALNKINKAIRLLENNQWACGDGRWENPSDRPLWSKDKE